MPQKRLPVLQKVSNLLRTPIFLTRIKKPVIPKLIFLKKSRKLKSFHLLKHYNYEFLEEYQFSPSSTPLIHYHRKQYQNRSSIHDFYSMLFLCRCFGGLKDRGGEAYCKLALDALPPIEGERSEADDEDGSIDEKAERFIERFYAEMRLQRQQSF